MTEKQFITAQELLEDSFRLGGKILESGFRPNFIVGIWRGGTPVGIAVQEVLDYFGIRTDHIAIRTSAYEEIGKRKKEIKVHGLNYIIQNVNAEESLLIVDDVFDTGLSIKAVIGSLKARSRKNTPQDIRVATVFYKPKNNLTRTQPDFFIHKTDKWLVFPHEISGLNEGEIGEYKPEIMKLIRGFKRS